MSPNHFVAIDHDGFAAVQGAAAERARQGRRLGPLDGIAVGVKDNMDVRGMTTGHGSAVFAGGSVATADATAVARLRATGAAILGKTHMTELACGTDGINPFLGDARNPRNPDHHPGGSSSGSAIAVATGDVALALGSDTGGSIRVPAAACGVVGLKPTYGRVSNVGMGVCAAPLDHIGPIASSVAVAAHGLRAMQNPGWSTTAVPAVDIAGLTTAVLIGDFVDQCSPDTMAAFEQAVAVIESLGCTVRELDLGIDLEETDDHANVLGRDLLDAFGPQLATAPPGSLSPELAYWLALFEQVSDNDYRAALSERDRVTAVVSDHQRDIDVLLCPTIRAGASTLAAVAHEDRSVRTGNLTLFNMTGQPSLTVPFGQATTGLPLGLLLTGRGGEDETVLALGAAFEAATN